MPSNHNNAKSAVEEVFQSKIDRYDWILSELKKRESDKGIVDARTLWLALNGLVLELRSLAVYLRASLTLSISGADAMKSISRHVETISEQVNILYQALKSEVAETKETKDKMKAIEKETKKLRILRKSLEKTIKERVKSIKQEEKERKELPYW